MHLVRIVRALVLWCALDTMHAARTRVDCEYAGSAHSRGMDYANLIKYTLQWDAESKSVPRIKYAKKGENTKKKQKAKDKAEEPLGYQQANALSSAAPIQTHILAAKSHFLWSAYTNRLLSTSTSTTQTQAVMQVQPVEIKQPPPPPLDAEGMMHITAGAAGTVKG